MPHTLRWLVTDDETLAELDVMAGYQTLRTARSATIEINGQRITLEPKITDPVFAILNKLEGGH